MRGAAGRGHGGRNPLGAAHGRRDGQRGGQHAARGRAPHGAVLLRVLGGSGRQLACTGDQATQRCGNVISVILNTMLQI